MSGNAHLPEIGSSQWSGTELAVLLTLPGVGPVRVLQIARKWECADDFWAGARWRKRMLGKWAEKLPSERPLPEALPSGVRLLGFFDENFPQALRSIPNPPPVLWIRGHLPKLTTAVAIVGTRKPSAFGVRVAESAAEAAVAAQLMVISGLAPGCDTVAHQRTLDLGGRTVAFLGGALMEPQPASNRALAEKILDSGGALVTEVAPARPETKSARVSRDRLQSGYSAGTVVAQTEVGGGALHTARFAIQQGRKLIVPVPPSGSAYESGCQGNLALAHPDGCDPSILRAKGALRLQIQSRRPVADFVPRTGDDLKLAIRSLVK